MLLLDKDENNYCSVLVIDGGVTMTVGFLSIWVMFFAVSSIIVYGDGVMIFVFDIFLFHF